ncbi:light harvesting complex A [Micractinium conductrix]|jgi:hypothetical protein|uniref:Chlorophyll a-b binding protein, chloroplastic n=1 Tax=Micractinium conductrix TaxID=554055 RepID=A0A2P6VEY5_9CHLO|nr:light harvesting complex A [Micractinium conductrix]|eukprot:PSC72652.1 light harvesting complex A [Micractinium conductrix]
MQAALCSTSAFVRPASVAARPARRSVVAVRAAAGWDPSAEVPAHLKGKDLAGNFGFDPLNLGKNEVALKWYQQAELQNGRWAMLGVAGILVQELLHKTGLGGAAANVYWFDAGNNTFWAPKETLIAISFLLFAWAESNRAQDFVKPGSNVTDPFGNKIKYVELGYPGFDPLSFTKGNYAELKQKEIKNGRLAMVAFLGILAQHNAQPGSPLDQLGNHLANPWKNHFINNGVSLPFLTEGAHNILGGSL